MIKTEVQVRWGDLDAVGHVNNTVYFQYFEEARVTLFAHLGLEPLGPKMTRGPILAATSCQFRRPVAHPDVLTCETWVRSIGRTSFVLAYRLTSQTGGDTVAEGDSAVVFYDYAAAEKVPLPDDLRRRLEANRAP